MDSSDDTLQQATLERSDFSPDTARAIRFRSRGDEGNEYVVLEAYEFDVRPSRRESEVAKTPRGSSVQAIRRWLI